MTAPHQFLTETRERFLKVLVGELPAARIREVYLFQPIKQGGVESGVAVVAAYQEPASGVGREASGETAASGVEPEASREDQIADAASAPEVEESTVAGVVDLDEVTGPVAEAEACELPAPDAQRPTPDDQDSPDAQRPTPDEQDAPDAPRPTPDADEKYTVYTARYRHTLKGPDRGKWEASIVAEADAPLLSIETVVRGVQRRAGDAEPPDHMSGDELRAALRIAPASDAA